MLTGLLLVLAWAASAQNGRFGVRFAIKHFDCANNKVSIAVQVKAMSESTKFLMGDANYRFDYDPRIIRNPAIDTLGQVNFSNQPPASDLNYAAQNLNGSSVGATLGTVSLNTIYGSGGVGAKEVGSSWMTVSCIRFDIVDASQCFTLDWHTDTEFPITGMNEVILLGNGNYDLSIVPAGGIFENFSLCTPSVCSGISAIDDINMTLKNTAVSGTAATNDESNGGAMTFSKLGPDVGGSFVLNANGSYTFTPTTNFVGEASTTYRVCNTAGQCDTAKIYIQVTDTPNPTANDKPIAQNDVAQTPVGTPVMGNLLNNDSDPDGDPLTISTTPVMAPTKGIVMINPDGSYTYTPLVNTPGQDTFTYRICDAGVPPLCDTAMVVVKVTVDTNTPFVNDPPNPQDDAETTCGGVAVSGNLAANDSDPNTGQTLTYTTTAVVAPTKGTVSISASGAFTYTPAVGQFGSDYFTYRVCDNGTTSLCDTASVYILINNCVQPPVVIETPKTTPEDSTNTICVGYTDPNIGDTHTPTLCGTKGGTATNLTAVNGQLCFTYTPVSNFNGQDTVCIILCDQTGACDTANIPITVTPKNDPPVVIDPFPPTLPEDTTITVCQTVGDPDTPNGPFSVSDCGTPNGGTTTHTLVGNQLCVTYTPTPNFVGRDTICVIVCDNTGLCDTIKQVVDITPKNDPPVVTETPHTIGEDSLVTICQTITDPDAGDSHVPSLCPGYPKNGIAGTPVITGNQVCFQYLPNNNFNGQDTVCLVVCDAAGACDTAKIPITVTPKNDPPVVIDPFPPTLPEDTTITVCQTVADPDTPNGPFTASNCGTPNGGTTTHTLVGNQLCITYTPTPNYNGLDTICVIVCDASGACDTVKQVVSVTPKNDPPVVTDPVAPVPATPGTPTTICTPFTDADAGDTHSAFVCGAPLHGTLVNTTVNQATRQVCITYTPAANYTGQDSICLLVCDNGNPMLCDTLKLVFDVTSNNLPPVATNDINSTLQNAPTSGNVLTNDTDPNTGQTLTTSKLDDVNQGVLTLSPNGSYIYTPTAGFIGADTLVYKVCDNGTPVLCDTAVLVIEVRPNSSNNNQPPVANDDNTATPSGTPITVDVKSNDFDPNSGQTLTPPTIIGTPTCGTATVGMDGRITYTPATGFVGVCDIQYRVCDNGSPVLCDTAKLSVNVYTDPNKLNNPPNAIDDAYATPMNTPVNGTTAPNDSDIDAGQTLSFSNISNPTRGSLVFNPNGTFTYTPNTGFTGLDSFRYKACDNGVPSLCDTATVYLRVNPVIVPPTNTAPVANPDNPVTNVNTPITIPVKANDFDPNGDPLSNPTITSPPSCGTATVNADGTIGFTPNTGFTGSCSFIYRVCDTGSPSLCDTALVTVKVDPAPQPANQPPVAINDNFVGNFNTALLSKTVATNDSDPNAGQILSYSVLTSATKGLTSLGSTGTFSYFPGSNFVGQDSFRYRVCDNGSPVLCDTAWAYITYVNNVSNTNLPPIAGDDTPETTADTPISINVRLNDVDPNGNPLSNPSIVTSPTCGTASVNASGNIDFTPTTGFVGTCSLTYQVCDNGSPALCDTAKVTIKVNPTATPTNRAPIAQTDATTTPMNTPVNGTSATNDSDPDGHPLTFATIGSPTRGTAVMNPNGTYIYTPQTGFVGRDSFPYRACDNQVPSLCANSWVYIDVTSMGQNTNLAPIATDDNTATTRNTPVTIPVKTNDTDANPNQTLSAPQIVTAPTCGTVAVNGDGTVTFTPSTNFLGVCTFTYRVCDNGSPVLCDTATVSVDVKAPLIGNTNLPPVAIDDASSGEKNAPQSDTVGDNDTDPNAGQTLTYTVLNQPSNGLPITLDPSTGDFTYTPIANFVGTDNFTYVVCDNGTPSLCDTATVYLTVFDKPCVTINLKVLLEGVYSTQTGLMRTTLNQRGLLPGQNPIGEFAVKTPSGQPYKGAPWNYAGTEGDTITTYPSTVVDWVLVSFRSSISNLTPTFRAAGWLHNDGTITFPNPCFQIPDGNFFVVIEHRNHMGVMSPATVPVTNGLMNFDFTTGDSYIRIDPPSFGQKAMSNGKFVMYAGDGKKDTQTTNFDINFNDSQLWKVESGIFDQYRRGDFNMDADVNFSDQVLWKTNNGRYSGVPH
jgi:hypothetical protein